MSACVHVSVHTRVYLKKFEQIGQVPFQHFSLTVGQSFIERTCSLAFQQGLHEGTRGVHQQAYMTTEARHTFITALQQMTNVRFVTIFSYDITMMSL